jgi:DNA-binding CsgD family transcriptional regulator
MHDVGNVAVPDRVLLKPGRLTASERLAMERHPEIGYRILVGSAARLLQIASTIAWTHHERFDGTGYPRGLGGDEIPIEGRIAAVADVYAALTHDRVYRKRLDRRAALEVMVDGRGQAFDPEVLDALLVVLDQLAAENIGPDVGVPIPLRPEAGKTGATVSSLSPRERQVLQLAADGLSAQEIAESLVISPGTIKTHFQHIYAKLDAHDRASAVATGMRRGFIE